MDVKAQRVVRHLAATLVLGVAVALGCRPAGPPYPEDAPGLAAPSVRLYLLSNVAGALEPCGCTEDQLGGLQHLASLLASEREAAPDRLLLAAGPLLFMDPEVDPKKAEQTRWKAETIASSMADMGLSAWAPGANDWAAGSGELGRLATLSKAQLLGANLASPLLGDRLVLEVGSTKVGIFGLSDPRTRAGRRPPGLSAGPSAAPGAALAGIARQQAAALVERGVHVLVALTAMDRGAALRVVDAVPELNLLLVGAPHADGDLDDEGPPPTLVGSTLVVETANHGQAVAVVDIVLLGDGNGPASLDDGGDIARAQRIAALSRRIRKLEVRIHNWERGGEVDPQDLAARRADLAKLRKKRAALDKASNPPETSHFRYSLEQVRPKAGTDEQVARRMRALYRRVNAHNQKAFADWKPEPAAAGQAHYVGAENCAPCHGPAHKLWQYRRHAKAYATLQQRHKEYDLECVGCHVTGYGKPGGSTVTHNVGLQNVQCEVCHGPGSLHVDRPNEPDLVTLPLDPRFCVDACHHPPHVEGFDPVAKREVILGPGHGRD